MNWEQAITELNQYCETHDLAMIEAVEIAKLRIMAEQADAMKAVNDRIVDVVALLQATPLVTEIAALKNRLDAWEEKREAELLDMVRVFNELSGKLERQTDRLATIDRIQDTQALMIEQFSMRLQDVEKMHDPTSMTEHSK